MTSGPAISTSGWPGPIVIEPTRTMARGSPVPSEVEGGLWARDGLAGDRLIAWSPSRSIDAV